MTQLRNAEVNFSQVFSDLKAADFGIQKLSIELDIPESTLKRIRNNGQTNGANTLKILYFWNDIKRQSSDLPLTELPLKNL